MSGVMELFTRKPAAVDYREALDAERLYPSLAEAIGRGRQMGERGRAFMAELETVRAKREQLVTTHGERALAAELAGEPLPTAALEAHERALEPLDREIRRLAGQVEAVLRAMPQQEAVISERRGEAAGAVRERARELAGPILAELAAALRAAQGAARRVEALRDAERDALEALGARGAMPWVLPDFFRDVDARDLASWERDMRAAGFDLPSED